MYNFLLFCLLFTNWAFATTFITPEETKDLKINGYSSFGDVNGDGYNDIFTSEFYYFNCGSFQCVGQVEIDEPSRIFINDQRGGFEELIQEVGFGETSLTDISLGGLWARGRSFQSVIADVNNDGKNDIIASDGRVFINKGDGQFEEPARPGIGSSINKISVIDIDNDGVLEIYNSGKLRKRTNLDPLTYSGDNSFTFDTRLSVEFADFNNDGLKDILTYGGPSKVTIYYNQPNGFSHNNKLVFDVSEPEALVVGDIDGNGTSDVILSNNNSLINIGGGQFEMANLSLDFGFYDSVIDDFEQYTPIKLIKYNNDNDPDLLIRKNNDSREFSDYFFVLINDGQGAFSIENAVSSIINTISGVMTSDFNNDSYEDFIVGKYGGLNTYNFNMAIDDEYHNHNIDPAISIEVNVLFNYNQGSSIALNIGERANATEYLPLRIGNQSETVYVASYPWYTVPNFLFIEPLRNFYFDPQPFYISDINQSGYSINQFDFINSRQRVYHGVTKGDVDNDGFEDLLIDYADCPELCDDRTTSIWFNSEDGFTEENSITLDFLSGRQYVTDFTGDGTNEIIGREYSSGQSKLLITNTENGTDYQTSEFLQGEISLILNVIDINGDNKSDVLFVDRERNLNVVYGDADLNTIVMTPLSLPNAHRYEFYDKNKDGYPDIYLVVDTDILYYENDQNGSFNFTQMYSLPFAVSRSFSVTDFNGDGVEEFVIGADSVFVFQQTDSGLTEIASFVSNDSNYQLLDFDNDGNDDLLTTQGIHFSRDFAFFTGLNYDPQRAGHGFSIEPVGNDDQMYTVFYTYDDDLYPQWYADLGVFDDSREDYWRITSDDNQAISFNYHYDTQSIVANEEDLLQGNIMASECGDTYGFISLYYQLRKNIFGSFNEFAQWCSQALVGYDKRPDNKLSGLWWAGEQDAGWGWSVSLVKRETSIDIVTVLYYYDALGKPRWLIGQASDFQQGQPITLEMNMVKGYPRWSTAPADLTLLPAGTMTLTLNEGTKDFSRAGVMSLDVTYPGPEGGHWVRDNVPVALFSNPRR